MLERGPQNAREIAQALGVEKSQINPVLYSTLAAVAEIGENWRWSLRPDFRKAAADDRVADRTVRLLKYFRDCVALDEAGPSCNEFDLQDRLALLPLDQPLADEWLRGTDGCGVLRIQRDDSVRIGVGMVVVREEAKFGRTEFKCAPLLVSRPIESLTRSGAEQALREGMTVNTSALKLASGAMDSDDLIRVALVAAERLELEASLTVSSLGSLCGNLPEKLAEFTWSAMREHTLRALLEMSTVQPVAVPVACLISAPASKFTEGLLEELASLSSSRSIVAQDTALRFAMGGSPPKAREVRARPTVEPIPLNQEQREAVESALTEPLTVIQGPPGTGKSQVVVAILANAAWRGQRVLFASKNNAAVDVVVSRLNGLATRPSVLRLGSKQANAMLLDQLKTILAGVPTERERAAFKAAEGRLDETHIRLEKSNSSIELADKRLLDLHRLESETQAERDRLGDDLFFGAAAFDLPTMGTSIDACEARWTNAHRGAQGLIVRALWPIFRGKRLAIARETSCGLAEFTRKLGGWPPPIPGEPEASEVARSLAACAQLRSRRDDLVAARKYLDAEMRFAGSPRTEDCYATRAAAIDSVKEASVAAWNAWLQVMEDRLPSGMRERLGALQSLLGQIATSDAGGGEAVPGLNSKFMTALEAAVETMPLWATTSLSVRKRAPLRPGAFDLVVIDESSQCDIASALPLLFRAKRAVIIGDSNQLSHITQITPAQSIRLGEKHGFVVEDHSWSYDKASLLDRALSLDNVGVKRVALREHFRCHPEIVGYSNDAFYDGRLIVRTRLDRLASIRERRALEWIGVEGSSKQRNGGSLLNEPEIEAVLAELILLSHQVSSTASIGVCAPFRAHIDLMKRRAKESPLLRPLIDSDRLLIDTVHKFQGNERDVMVFSPVISRNASPGSLRFLAGSKNIFNVAVTRARAHLVVVGDKGVCAGSDIAFLTRFVEYCDRLHGEASVGGAAAGYTPTAPGEAALAQLLKEEGIPMQAGVSVDQYTIAFALQQGERRIALEVDADGYRRASDPIARRDDMARWDRLRELGWTLCRVAPHEIVNDPARVLTRLWALLRGMPQSSVSGRLDSSDAISIRPRP